MKIFKIKKGDIYIKVDKEGNTSLYVADEQFGKGSVSFMYLGIWAVDNFNASFLRIGDMDGDVSGYKCYKLKWR